MIVLEEWQDGVRVTDNDTAELSVAGDDFAIDGAGPDISRPVDETIAVTASELRFPLAVVYAFPPGDTEPTELDLCGGSLSLSANDYIVDIDTEIKTYLEFSSAARIERTDDFESVVVSFPERTRVVVGFRSHHEFPAGTITVPDSPAALVTAITHLSSSHKTTSSNRSYPTLRGHPPLLERGDELEIPDRIRDDTPETGIELLVPPDYETLYVTAPLAYYLQATVRTFLDGGVDGDDDTSTPRLRLTDHGITHRLSAPPELEHDVERLLRKTFFLDCLVRNAGPYGTDLAERRLVDTLGLEIDALYEASPQDRLATYLEVPHTAVESQLPDWHLSTYVAPEFDRLGALPYLLDRMSLIYRPRTSELEGQELVERSLEAFYRGNDRTTTSGGQVASVDIVKPELRRGRVHGWLGDGVPIDVFNATTEAYQNRLDYLERARDSTSICVVLNDPEMAGEHDDVAEIYRERSEELPMAVTVEESLRTAELARVFEDDYDFVHYIGHCETDGLCCPDGSLSTESLDRCNAQTFFLNACGSFYEGRTLIEKGSVAGAVTFTKVLNEHAVKVGSTFAKLLVHGFSIERALALARRRIMMGKDYTVVGDGTHSLTQGEHRLPPTATIDALEDSRGQARRADFEKNTTSYLVTFDCYSTRITGSYYFPHTEGNEHAYLCGTESSFIVTESELATLLKETEASVIYDGDIYWSKSLWSQFDG